MHGFFFPETLPPEVQARLRQAQCEDWQWQVAHALTPELFGMAAAALPFPFRATPYYAALADWTNPQDPILRQFFPDPREWKPEREERFGPDPFGEAAQAAIAPGIKQRFPDRLLAMVSLGCSTYCRHCTRRGLLHGAKAARLEEVVAAVKARPKVREVLLSGGDPMILPDAEVLRWVRTLAELPQLDAIRLCTRTPVVLPMRWTPALVEQLAASKRVWVQTQFNHPRELTEQAIRVADCIVEHGLPLSNQSVLLRGVNDSPEVLAELCAKLQRHRIRPYYLFECDPIAGIDHFRTAPDVAPALKETLQTRLGGLACPRVVRDLPGAAHKTDV